MEPDEYHGPYGAAPPALPNATNKERRVAISFHRGERAGAA